jgi:hypothetical protein
MAAVGFHVKSTGDIHSVGPVRGLRAGQPRRPPRLSPGPGPAAALARELIPCHGVESLAAIWLSASMTSR